MRNPEHQEWTDLMLAKRMWFRTTREAEVYTQALDSLMTKAHVRPLPFISQCYIHTLLASWSCQSLEKRGLLRSTNTFRLPT